MGFAYSGEDPAILQLQKWGSSQVQFNLSEFYEGFISPRRELLLLLSYHGEALLLPLGKGKSIKDPQRGKDSQNPDASFSCSLEHMVPDKTELGDDHESTSQSSEMETRNINAKEVDFTRLNCFPSISDVNSVAWGRCEDLCNQHDNVPFKELLFVLGSEGVTAHAFCQSYITGELIAPSEQDDVGQGLWMEWGPSTASAQPVGAVYDSLDVSDMSWMDGQKDVSSESVGVKRWFRTFLTEVETVKSDGVVYTKFPDKSSVPSSASVVSFTSFLNCPQLLEFLSDGCPTSHDKQNGNISVEDLTDSISIDSRRKSPDALVDRMNTSYKCFKMFSNDAQCLMGFALNTKKDVPINTTNTDDGTGCKVLVAVARLINWGIQWVCSVTVGKCSEGRPEIEWPDFRFSHAFLISLNVSGLVSFYVASTGEHVACLDSLNVCGVSPSLVSLEQNNSSLNMKGSCTEENKCGQFMNQAGDFAGRRRFKRLLVISHSLTFCVIDESGLTYVIHVDDHIPKKYYSLERLHPQYRQLGNGMLAAWEVAAAEIGYQRAFSDFYSGKEQRKSSINRESSFTDNTQGERKYGSYGSSLSADAFDVNKNRIFGSRLNSSHSRKVFLPIDGSKEDGVVCFSPFGITWLVKGKNSEGNGKCRLVHSSLHVNLTINDDSSYNIQGWDALVDEAVGCSFHGYLYLVTKDGIAVVLPRLSLPSNFCPVEAIGYQQSFCSAGSKYGVHKLHELESIKRPFSAWKVEVLDKALLYEGPEVADQLCLENGWDLSFTWIRHLQLALEYLKFEEIEKSLEMLAHVNLAEEGILRMLLAAVYLISCKVGNDNEITAASRLLALGTSFATKMIREYGLLQHKKDGMESWKAVGTETSCLPSELIDTRPDGTGDLERLQKMAHFLEIIRNLQWRLLYKCKRLGQELVDLGEAFGETDLSQDESRLLDLNGDVSSLGALNHKEGGPVPASEMERNNGEDLALMPVDTSDSKNISALDTFKERSLISEGNSFKSVFSLENPKDMIARWEIDNLDVKTVVKDAILSGRLPLAVLKLHLHRSKDLMSDQENQDTFNEVREVGRAIAYDLFLKGETGLAVETLQRLGEDIETSLKQLVFGTVRRSLRMQIVEIMKGLSYLGPHEWNILEKISLIERVYPCSSFRNTFSCRHKELKGVSNENAPEEIKLHLLAPLGRDLVIACGELDGVVLGSWMNVNEQPIAPEADDDSTHSSYWSAAAVWFDVWDQRVVDCIVLDQPLLMGVNVLWESQLDYHIRHSDWLGVSRLLEVIPSYALSSGSLSVSLDGVRSSPVDDFPKPDDCSSYIYSLEEVDAVCMSVPSVQIFRFSANSMCSMWLLRLMERELAKKFIFLKDYWGATADIVALLAQSGFIRDVHKSLPMDESLSDSVLSISDAISHADSIQAFHKVVVHYCSQHNLLNFLDLYLDHHKLALDHESVNWMQDAAGDNQWAKWLLLQRVKGKEYEASFCNARAVVSRNLVAGNSFSSMEIEDIIHTVDDIAEGAGEMAALATLMYAPIPIQDCLSSGSVNRLYSSAQCTLENLRPFLQRFPTLWRALTAACFGQDPTCNSIGPKPKLFGYSDLLDYLNWRESVFFSSAHDTSLSQMLPCWFSKAVRRLIQLYVQGPLGWQSIADLPVGDPSLLRDIVPSDISPLSWEVAIHKHIEEELYDSSLKESRVGIEHHLHRGRALAAFNHLLSNRVQKLKSESSHRGQHVTPVQGQTSIQSDVQMLLSPITQSEQLFLSSVVPLAIVHFADSVLVASCAFLLELCGLPTGTLQIDVAALRRIASFIKSGPRSNHLEQPSPRGSAFHSTTYDNDISESLARGLADDYCQNDWYNQANNKSDQFTTSGRQPSRALMLVLQHLETASLPSSADGVTCGSWLLTGNGDGVELRSKQKTASEHWNLVTTFCQAHQIPLSTRYLAILARDNDWVGFLSEAQTGGYPLETVMQVASKEFGDARLKTHILTVLKSMQSRKKFSSSSGSDTGEKTSFPDENVYKPAELFGIIAECERQARPGEALLLQAKNLCWSLLAAIASCFADVSPLSCLTVWLEITAARETSAIKVNNAASQIANNVAAAVEATNSLPTSAKAPTVHYNRKNPKRRRLMEPLSVHSLSFAIPDEQKGDGNVRIRDLIVEEECEKQVDQDEKVSNHSDEVAGSLSRMVAVLCEQHLFLPLLRAFEMFLPSCSLLPFIRALQAFSQMRLSEASAHLGSFSARIKEEPHVSTQAGKEGKVGTSWISSTAVKAADAMLSKCPSPYEKRCLLHLLSATDFGDGGPAATYYQRLYWKVNLAEPSLRKNDGLHLGNEPLDDASLLTALEKHGHWEQARNWAKHLEASGGSWKSAMHHVTETQAESMVAEWKEFLWDVPEERVALWGHCQTLFLRYSFPPLQAGLFFLKHAEAPEKDLPARELHELLLLSLQWLSGMITLCSPVCPMHLLREIETRAWLLAVESETQVKSEGEFTLSNREPASSKGSNIIDRTASVITKMDSHINSVRIKSGERNDIKESNQSHLKTTPMSDSSSSSAILGNAKVKRRAKGFVPSRKSVADPVDRSNEPEAGSVNVTIKEDSQLPDDNLKLEATFSKWEERVGPAELDRAVLSLLEFGQIAASRQLQHKLSPGCIPSEFKLVDAALKLAAIATPNNKVSQLVLDGELRSVMQSYNLFPTQHVIDPLQVLESLALLLTEGRGRGLCRRIFSVVKAANVLGLPFSEAFEKHPIELLQLLSLKAQDSFEEAKLLVQSHYMPAASIAQILAESFLKGLLAAHRGGYMESQKEEGPAPLLWRFSDFLKWAELCPSEPEIGHALLRLVATCQGIPHACEVELLILSHHFYKSSACLDGVDVLVDLAFKKVEAYVSEGDFPCLARLITGVGNFHALNFILGILIENGQLDLLLQKFSAAADANAGTAEAVRGFRMAVLTLLKQFNPNDHDAFSMVYSHFDMKHETASLLESRADLSCKEWSLRSDKDQTDDLLASMRYFIEAAEVYSSIDAGNKTRQACAQASLLSLQIRMPDLHFIYLSETNARRALVEQSHFQEALIVAEAYGLNQPGEWALVLWNQMLRPELIEQFVAEFVAVLPLQPSMLLELARFYRAEVAARGDQSQFSVWLTGGGLPAEWAKYLERSFRCLLKRTRDLRLRYQLATIATGFIDVVDACNRAFDKIPENAGPLVLRKGHGGGYLPLM